MSTTDLPTSALLVPRRCVQALRYLEKTYRREAETLLVRRRLHARITKLAVMAARSRTSPFVPAFLNRRRPSTAGLRCSCPSRCSSTAQARGYAWGSSEAPWSSATGVLRRRRLTRLQAK